MRKLKMEVFKPLRAPSTKKQDRQLPPHKVRIKIFLVFFPFEKQTTTRKSLHTCPQAQKDMMILKKDINNPFNYLNKEAPIRPPPSLGQFI